MSASGLGNFGRGTGIALGASPQSGSFRVLSAPPREGDLLKSDSKPQIYLLEGGMRRWIPDVATLLSKWTWDDVRTLADQVISLIPLGTPVPSVISAPNIADGMLIEGPRSDVYVMEGRRRRQFPDWESFYDLGFDPTKVQVFSQGQLDAIPVGDPMPQTSRLIIEWAYAELPGVGNHWMGSRVALNRQTGKMQATTRTTSYTWFGGFIGGVVVQLVDVDEVVIAQTPMQRYGVDGTVIGRSDRTEFWTWDCDPAISAQVVTMWAHHTWAPDDLLTILEKLNRDVKKIGEIVKSVSDIASSFGSKSPAAALPATK